MQQSQAISPVIVLFAIEGMFMLMVMIFAAIAAGAVRRQAPYRFWYFPLESAVAIGMLAAVYVVSGIRAAPVYLAVSGGIGLVLGAVPAAMARPYAAAGRFVFKRSGMGLFSVVAAHGLLAAAAWWGTKPVMSATLGVVVLATGAVLGGDVVRLLVGAVRSYAVRRIPMAGLYVPPEPSDDTAASGAPTAGAGSGVAAASGASAGGAPPAIGPAEPPPLAARPSWAWDLAEGRVARPVEEEEPRGLLGRLGTKKKRG